MIIALDVTNAYNEMQRAAILEVAWKDPKLRELFYYLWKTKMIKGYIGLGSSERMQKADFCSDEGEHQGAVERRFGFCIGFDAANRATHERLVAHGGMIVGGMDDTYISAPPEIAFEILHEHSQRLSEIGLSLNISKTKCYMQLQDTCISRSTQCSGRGSYA